MNKICVLINSGPLKGHYGELLRCWKGEVLIDIRGSLSYEPVENLAIFSEGHPDYPYCDV